MNPKRLQLDCPSCHQSLIFDVAELADGAVIRCLHCGEEAQVRGEWNEDIQDLCWTLDEVVEADDERR